MANIDNLIPFILYYEAGLPRKYTSLPFEQMFQYAKQSGWANDPDDAGGATMCGITIGTFQSYAKKNHQPIPTTNDLRNITPNQWRDVLQSLFWDKWKADEIKSQAIANILVDWVWASGINGIKIPQRILGVVPDGIVGHNTLSAVNRADEDILFSAIHQARIKFVDDIVKRKPSQAKFIRGWKRRINAITINGLLYN